MKFVEVGNIQLSSLPLTLWTNYEAATVRKSKEKSELLVAIK
jgi:hypothetical protein